MHSALSLEEHREKVSLLDQRVYEIAQDVAEIGAKVAHLEQKVEQCRDSLSERMSEHQAQVAQKLDMMSSAIARLEPGLESMTQALQKLQDQEIARKTEYDIKEKNKKMLFGLILTGGGAGLAKIAEFLASLF